MRLCNGPLRFFNRMSSGYDPAFFNSASKHSNCTLLGVSGSHERLGKRREDVDFRMLTIRNLLALS
jgi:hypothetical protein